MLSAQLPTALEPRRPEQTTLKDTAGMPLAPAKNAATPTSAGVKIAFTQTPMPVSATPKPAAHRNEPATE